MGDKPKVRVLLDVDGVLNAVGSGDGWGDFQQFTAKGYRITWSPTMCTRLAQILDHESIEVSWLTTWAKWANKRIGARMGFPRFRVAGYPPEWGSESWWKLVLAQDLYERDLIPFAWIDDDLGFREGIEAKEWLSTIPETDYLTIAPLPGAGLQPDHLDRLEDFLTGRVND